MIRTVREGTRSISYTLITSRARRSVSLKVTPDGAVRLYAPDGIRLKDADRCVKENLAAVDSALSAYRLARTKQTDTFLYKGRRVRVYVKPAGGRRITVEGDVFTVYTDDTQPQAVRGQLRAYLVKNALDSIRAELSLWAPRVNRPFGRVTVREQKTRWGSCSSAHNLNFNWKLIMAPPEALRYVVIHELCHLKCFNHSPRFWQEVQALMPDYAVWKKWLKDNGKQLTLD
ncbi:MAG: M48 family metallopeptidase [Clostridia bacterium]|nr:M48 family metallopeptidase [Clostridia bacterium]